MAQQANVPRQTAVQLENNFGRPVLTDRARMVVIRRIMPGFADRLVQRVTEIQLLGRGWVVLFVDSPGGFATEALEGMRRVRELLDATVNPLAAIGVYVASAAVFVYTAADLRIALPGFQLLVHAPFIAKANVQHGTLDSHRAAGNDEETARLERLVNREISILLRDAHGRMRESDARRMLSRAGGDTLLPFEMARGYGLADVERTDAVPEFLSNMRVLPPRHHATGQMHPIQSSELSTCVYPTEIIAFSERAEDFKELNTVLLAASTDSKFSQLEWICKPRKQGDLGEMKIPVLADSNHKISRDYGVLKEEDEGIAYDGLFIIDSNGVLRQISINDLLVGRSVDETLRLIQAFQFVEKCGEVCPANWKPGADTIKSSPQQSEEFFEKQQK